MVTFAGDHSPYDLARLGRNERLLAQNELLGYLYKVAEEELTGEELPLDTSRDIFHFTKGALVYAGHHYHDELNPVHSHSFVEIAFVIAGEATHLSLGGRQRLSVGDVVLLRPGVWHGYEDCSWQIGRASCRERV